MFRRSASLTLGAVVLAAGLLIAPSAAQATRMTGENGRSDQNGTINYGSAPSSVQFAYAFTNNGTSAISGFATNLTNAKNAGLPFGVWGKANVQGEVGSSTNTTLATSVGTQEADLMYNTAIAADPHIFDPGHLIPKLFVSSGNGSNANALVTAFDAEFKAKSSGIMPIVSVTSSYSTVVSPNDGEAGAEFKETGYSDSTAQTGSPSLGNFSGWRSWWYANASTGSWESSGYDYKVVVNGSDLSGITLSYQRLAKYLTHQINTEFKLSSNLYANSRTGSTLSGDAYDWPSNVQLRVLTAAAAVDPSKYTTQMTDFESALENSYLVKKNGVWGFNASAGGSNNRLYDDNGGNLEGLMEMYNINHSSATLTTAENIMAFELSGEDSVQGGGIYESETNKAKKVSSATLQTVVGALKLYQATGQSKYLDDANRLYTWETNTLEASDGLFWMNIADNGTINKTQMASNAGWGISAQLLFYDITGNTANLNTAIQMATTAKQKWIGGSLQMNYKGQWAFHLMDAWLRLYEETGNSEWLTTVANALNYVYDNVRDSNGHYAATWGTPVSGNLSTWYLIDQASIARVYWRLAADSASLQPSLAVTPAPSSLALMGVAGILLLVPRRKRAARCVEIADRWGRDPDPRHDFDVHAPVIR